MKLQDGVQTVEETGEGLFTDRSSKFQSYLHYCNDEQEARSIRNALKKEHHKAVHVVWAYRIGLDNIKEFCTDDGEPSGSSGLPVLNELKRNNLSDVALFVVRYYGGKKLGVPGLINAYRSSAFSAIEHARLKPLEYQKEIKVKCRAEYQHLVIEIVNNNNAEIIDAVYGEICQFTIEAPSKNETIEKEIIGSNYISMVHPSPETNNRD